MDTYWFKSIINKLSLVFKFNKINSPSYKSVKKTKIENKAQVQIINQNQGFTFDQAKDLLISVKEDLIKSVANEARQDYEYRQNEFFKPLIDKIKGLPEEEIAKLKEPDTLFALMEAAQISGRKQNSELRTLLSNLVLKRIKNDKTSEEELKNIVFNEAISTITKLTVNQLKIITLSFLLSVVHPIKSSGS